MATNNLLNQTLRMCEKHPHLRWSGCWAWTGCWGTDRLLGMDQLLGLGLAARQGPAAGARTGCWGLDWLLGHGPAGLLLGAPCLSVLGFHSPSGIMAPGGRTTAKGLSTPSLTWGLSMSPLFRAGN